MALTLTTLAASAGANPSDPVFHDRLSFAGDATYPTGGSAFLAKFQTKCGAGREILAIVPGDCGGYHVAYDHSSGKLKVYYSDLNAVGDGPDIEVPNATDLSAVTFNLLVLSKLR